VGFFDSFKTGLSNFASGLGDFLGDVSGAAVAAAPTIIPILQSTGVLPTVQPTFVGQSAFSGQLPSFPRLPSGAPPIPTRRIPRTVTMPGGSPTRFSSGVPSVPSSARFHSDLAAPVGPFPVGFPARESTSPSGVVNMPAFQNAARGFAPAALTDLIPSFDIPFVDVVPQGGGASLSALTTPYVRTMAGARAQPFVSANPVTGRLTWFKPAGRPILWSGDLTACKRVGRIAARARRSRGKR